MNIYRLTLKPRRWCYNSITYSIADHLPIIQISIVGELTYHEKNVIRCFTPKYLEKFKTSVEQIDFSPVLNETNFYNSYENFNNVVSAEFQNSSHKNAPNIHQIAQMV